MLVEFLSVIGYYILMFAIALVGFRLNILLLQIDQLWSERGNDKEKSMKNTLLKMLIDLIHSGELGLLLLGLVILFRPISPIVSDILLALFIGFTIPDLPRILFRIRDFGKYVKAILFLPILPAWAYEFLRKVLELSESIEELEEEGETSTVVEETAKKLVEDILKNEEFGSS